MTNGDRIRQMTDEELAKFLCLLKDKLCFACSYTHVDDCEGISCEEARAQWLRKEVSEDAAGLIDADALKKELCDFCGAMNDEMLECREEGCITIGMIDNQPTIEPKRGEWIQYSRNADETYIECSNCCVASRPRHLQMVTRTGSGLPDYCPNCGAKMFQTGGTISKERYAEIVSEVLSGGYDNG